MRKCALVLLVLFLLIAFSVSPSALANRPLFLDLRTVTPVSKMERSFSFSLPVADAPFVSFKCSALSAPRTGKRITAERITFTSGEQTVGPHQAVMIDPPMAARKGYMHTFLLNIHFLPSDPPGEYEGMIYAVLQHTEEDTEQIPIKVKVRILPWIKIQTANPHASLVINQFLPFTTSNLQAIEPIKLLVASNSPWRLYLRVGNTTPFKAHRFPLQVSVARTLNADGFKESLLLNGDAQLVAFGPPTVVGDGSVPTNYWTELYLSASISNWRQYPAGDHELILSFFGQTAEH